MRASRGAATLGLLLSLALAPASARAQAHWDGLDLFLRTARSQGTEVVVPDSLDLSRLDAKDAVLIVGPEESLPIAALTAFLRDGGRIALLDDFGSGDRLLSAYQVTRLLPPEGDVPALRKSRELLIAYPASEHPLVEGVDLLLTNGATALSHHDLKPVFTFGHTDRALVLAGAVGAGRLVAVGDASLLINQAMTISSHQRFARNLLAYLKRIGGRVWLVDAHTRFQGNYGPSTTRALAQVDAFLKRVAQPNLPAGVLSLLSLGLCAIAAVIVVGSLPRRSPYARSELVPRATVYAGFAARVTTSGDKAPNLIWTLLDYRREFMAELTRLLAVTSEAQGAEALIARARSRGLRDNDVTALRSLLTRFDQVAAAADSQLAPPRIRVSELRNVVRQGEELLARLGNG